MATTLRAQYPCWFDSVDATLLCYFWKCGAPYNNAPTYNKAQAVASAPAELHVVDVHEPDGVGKRDPAAPVLQRAQRFGKPLVAAVTLAHRLLALWHPPAGRKEAGLVLAEHHQPPCGALCEASSPSEQLGNRKVAAAPHGDVRRQVFGVNVELVGVGLDGGKLGLVRRPIQLHLRSKWRGALVKNRTQAAPGRVLRVLDVQRFKDSATAANRLRKRHQLQSASVGVAAPFTPFRSSRAADTAPAFPSQPCARLLLARSRPPPMPAAALPAVPAAAALPLMAPLLTRWTVERAAAGRLSVHASFTAAKGRVPYKALPMAVYCSQKPVLLQERY